jgi:hypothetical protein
MTYGIGALASEILRSWAVSACSAFFHPAETRPVDAQLAHARAQCVRVDPELVQDVVVVGEHDQEVAVGTLFERFSWRDHQYSRVAA